MQNWQPVGGGIHPGCGSPPQWAKRRAPIDHLTPLWVDPLIAMEAMISFMMSIYIKSQTPATMPIKLVKWSGNAVVDNHH